MKVSMDRFEAAVLAALESIPQQFKPYLDNTEFVIEQSSADGLLGLYEGATALAAGQAFPERVTVYKREHERLADSWEDLVDEVRRTILHEVGHHFGMEEEELPH
jgi:predicted Zn-dependent protease with MMP-like domain